MSSKPRFVRCPKCLNVLPEPSNVPVYKCGGCGTTLQAKKRNNSTLDSTSQRPDDDSSGKRKVDQVFSDQEAGSSSKQQLQPSFTDESDQNSDHDDLHRSSKDQDAANKAINGSVDAPSQKIKQPSIDHKASSSSNQQSQVHSTHNDPRSSTELSGHEDPESSPEATGHNRIDQNQDQQNTTVDSLNQQLVVNTINELDQNSDSYREDPESSPEATVDDNRIDESYNDDHDQVFLSCRREIEFEESGSEFEEAFTNMKPLRDSDSFKSFIAEKLLDTRQKQAVDLDEDDDLSADESTDLHHQRRFDRISSVETTEAARFIGKSYYEYEGSVSSFDGNDNQNLRKYRTGEHVDSGNRNRFNPPHRRFGKEVHRSIYGSNPRHRSHMISENPKLERIELLKKVRELQNQIDRTSISNPHQVPLFNNPGRYNHRMAFSGETTSANRLLESLDGSTCPHCHPRDRHFSAQLPHHQQVCCNGPHYGPSTYYSPRVSGPSSPIQNPIHNQIPIHNRSESEFSVPDDYRHRINDVIKKKKRYVRPIAGGSPWIACYRCSKLLELPQSVFVFNKKYHSLKCGGCMKVLNFTLSNGTHVSRYYPEENMAAPPSSEVEDYEVNGSRAGPVSCSDSSFQKSYSTETDRNGSWEFIEERRKATMSRDPSGSTQASSLKVLSRRKMTSEGKAGPRPNGSPLHRLMGYATPSRVIRG